ncbi:ExbD/TolR family protein [Rhodovulum sp. YNF3179]|uniref:ExbD/TolR family protein n=1 Tax=Rhodovulum sp. YNF3179 TaxID=3425127 RepID=UPI003D33F1AB
MFDFAAARRARRPSLTPMIDVVFLLLVFFMLAARFGSEGALPLALGGGAGDWTGPPRLVEIAADGVRLNGVATDPAGLAAALEPLVETRADPVVLRATGDADLARLVALMERLSAAGYTNLVLVE